MFDIGQHVICTGLPANKRPSSRFFGNRHPQKGEVLTIRDIEQSPITGNLLLRFIEIKNPSALHAKTGLIKEGAYPARCFRPLRKTNISIFTAMLTSAPSELQRVDLRGIS